jgi:hypothetical protein
MASTYVNNLRLNELGTGDGSGTWGTTTNSNLELIGEAFGFGTEAITTNADTHTTTVADGASDAGRAMYLKYTGTLDSACTITIAPNTMKRMQYIENGTSGSQNIIISQGSGANITITPGDTKAVYLDGAGSGAAVVDAFASLSVVDLDVDGTLEADAITINGTAIGSIYSTLANPTFTGAPLAPTAGAGVNNTQIATTAYVTTAIGNADAFPQGTSMLFQQTSAPTGWTKQTTHNDKSLRLTSGTVGTGGSVAFSTALGAGATVAGGSVTGDPTSNIAATVGNLAVSISGSIANTTLSINQIPSHTHAIAKPEVGGNTVNTARSTGGATVNNNTFGTQNAGGGGAHSHTHNLSGSMSGAPGTSGNVTAGNLAVGASTAAINVQYVDFIIANKD